ALMTRAVVPFADSFGGTYAKEESSPGIDVVIFEIEALQPRIVPANAFGFHESFQQPFLRNPVDPANERFGFVAQRLQRETPALEQPIGFFIHAAEVRVGELVELP